MNILENLIFSSKISLEITGVKRRRFKESQIKFNFEEKHLLFAVEEYIKTTIINRRIKCLSCLGAR